MPKSLILFMLLCLGTSYSIGIEGIYRYGFLLGINLSDVYGKRGEYLLKPYIFYYFSVITFFFIFTFDYPNEISFLL